MLHDGHAARSSNGNAVVLEVLPRLLLAGLDVIGTLLTEINVTCPTGFVRSNALYGIVQEAMFWDAVEKKL